MYAVVRAGGKQYRVEEGRHVKFDRLAGDVGATVELGDVLLMANGDEVTVGAPLVSGARVLGTIAEQGRARKIVVFRYKAKTRSRKKTGHRQHFTRVMIDDILAPGEEPKPKQAKAPPPGEDAEPAPKGRRARRAKAATAAPAEASAELPEESAEAVTPEVEAEGAPEAEAPATQAETETEVVAEKPKRRGLRRKKE